MSLHHERTGGGEGMSPATKQRQERSKFQHIPMEFHKSQAIKLRQIRRNRFKYVATCKQRKGRRSEHKALVATRYS
ncbi:hypothetical protein E2C01_039881 [Portunus trituberculatus]|uniref:Uncharacterized protein n=1 Tax=Portunus trituberculatus TaxID=210409 RepID=A0A5B7FFX3_PORTR|nr:hypothetical protein [Portunus trituberculatus]